jgi:uncharacterized protein (DUF697 family)
MTDDVALARQRRDARETIDTHVMLAVGASMIPSPLVDIVAITGIEVRLIGALARIYGYPVPTKLVLGKLLASLIGSLGPLYFTTKIYSTVKAIPLVGHAAVAGLLAAVNGAAVYAVGRVFQEHYESGGLFLSGDPAGIRRLFRLRYHEGKTLMPGYLRGDGRGDAAPTLPSGM